MSRDKKNHVFVEQGVRDWPDVSPPKAPGEGSGLASPVAKPASACSTATTLDKIDSQNDFDRMRQDGKILF